MQIYAIAPEDTTSYHARCVQGNVLLDEDKNYAPIARLALSKTTNQREIDTR